MAAPEARRRILEAACDLIAAEGIDEVRIARVATKAGASTSLVHHYFSTREELLEEALLHSFEQVGDERFGDERPEQPTATPPTRWRGRSGNACRCRARRSEAGCSGWSCGCAPFATPTCGPSRTQLYRRYRDWMADVIRSGIESGEFRAGADADARRRRGDGAARRRRRPRLIGDPGMDIERARSLVARALAAELDLDAKSLGG